MITHRFRFVKNFFQVFSNFFEALSFAALRGYLAPASQPTRLGYHTQFALSRTFFKFSKLFSKLSNPRTLGPPAFPTGFALSQSACLYQQNRPALSTPFFIFFALFFHFLFHTHILGLMPPFYHKICSFPNFSFPVLLIRSLSPFYPSPVPRISSQRVIPRRRTTILRKASCGKTPVVIP